MPLTSTEDGVHVPAFDPGRGMSAGTVSVRWWRDTGAPILIDRFGAQHPPADRSGDV